MPTDLNNGPSPFPPPSSHMPGALDPHGQAALLLVESLIHGLKERSVLTVVEAVDIIETAADVQYDMADQADGAGSVMRQAASLLTAMAASLRADMEADRG